MGIESRGGRVVARGVGRGPYRKHSLEEKRAIVQQCLAPGASVAGIALEHGVNANLVRKWIHKSRAGEYGTATSAPLLLPVQLREAIDSVRKPGAVTKGHIDIELPAGRVRVHGSVDAEVLQTVLASFRR